MRRLPPILPPFFPISDMILEISDLVELGIDSAVERSTIRWAAWFTSDGRLLIRFGMPQVCHGARTVASSLKFKVAHYLKISSTRNGVRFR